MTRLLAAVLALGALFAAVASGCGGDDDATPTAAASPAATAKAAGAASPTGSAPGNTATAPAAASGQSLGDATAKVTLTAFEDFQCPFCLRYTNDIEPTLIREYVNTGKVRYQFRHYPVLGAESVASAVATTCAGQQNKFWPFHDRLYKAELDAGQLNKEQLNAGRFTEAVLKQYAGELGLDRTTFDSCYASQAALQQVTDDYRLANSLGLPGTPSFTLNGKPIAQPKTLDDWRKLLDNAVAGR